MESKLISIVRDVEIEAERILREARDQASALQSQGETKSARLFEEKKSAANRQSEELLQEVRTKTQQDMERSSAREREALVALLRRAEARIGKAAQLILDKLGKL